MTTAHPGASVDMADLRKRLSPISGGLSAGFSTRVAIVRDRAGVGVGTDE
jgi:hypothetical protein